MKAMDLPDGPMDALKALHDAINNPPRGGDLAPGDAVPLDADAERRAIEGLEEYFRGRF
jgi:hypothetical protein